MTKFFTTAKLLAVIALAFFFSACVNEQDAEYTENQANATEVQPQLIAANDNNTKASEVEVNLPNANENIETNSNASEVKFTLTPDKNAKATNASTKTTELKETPLKPTVAKNASEVEKAKAVPTEVIKPTTAPVNAKVQRGAPAPVITSQSRGLPEKPATSNAMPTARGAMPVMDHEEYDFGNVPEGTKVVHTFTLKNNGSEDLYIQDVDAGCNCTTTDYTFEAIAPGGSTPIKVTFDSNTKVGTQMKNVIISTNNGTKKVRLKGTVFPKDRNY